MNPLDHSSLTATLLLGFVLGLRHATDADHLVAVTTIVSRQRSMSAASKIGAAWGVGHTLTIMLVGSAIVLFNVVVSAQLGLALELGVALMLIALGILNLGTARVVKEGPKRLLQSLAVGVVHGLAGSAAVALLILATIHEPEWAVLYLLIFGVGTLVGMTLLTSLIALPFALASGRFTQINKRMVQISATASIVLGLVLAYHHTDLMLQ